MERRAWGPETVEPGGLEAWRRIHQGGNENSSISSLSDVKDSFLYNGKETSRPYEESYCFDWSDLTEVLIGYTKLTDIDKHHVTLWRERSAPVSMLMLALSLRSAAEPYSSKQ